jgi:hypothetical protein
VAECCTEIVESPPLGGIVYSTPTWYFGGEKRVEGRVAAKFIEQADPAAALILKGGDTTTFHRQGICDSPHDVLGEFGNRAVLGEEWVPTIVPKRKSGAGGFVEVRTLAEGEKLSDLNLGSSKQVMWKLDALAAYFE